MGQHLSETETLLWNLGRDPNLASTMGLIVLLDGRPDPDRLRTTLGNAAATVERLRQRVTTPILPGALARPEWETDRWFDLDHHVRFIGLTGPNGRGQGGLGDLRRLAGQLISDPFDEARPLWQFHVVTGLRGGRSALVGKFHHSISDGHGLLRLAGSLLEFEADTPPPDPIDLDAILASETATGANQQSDSTNSDRPERASADDGDDGAGQTTGQPGDGNGVPTPDDPADGGGTARRLLNLLGQAAKIPGPIKVFETGAELLASTRAVTEQLPRSKASPLWSTRSGNRRIEFCAVPLAGLQARAEELEVTINDLFVAACGQAAVHYHDEHDVELDHITATVVVSTGAAAPDDPVGGSGDNAFIPVPIELPGTAGSAEDRLAAVHREVKRRRRALDLHPDMLSTIGTIGGLVPASVVAALTLDRAARVDFATSNLPGPPVPTWLAGRPVERIHPVGPVAGTAFNVTFMSYDGQALMGLHIDPAAVDDPPLLARCLSRGFGDLGIGRR